MAANFSTSKKTLLQSDEQETGRPPYCAPIKQQLLKITDGSIKGRQLLLTGTKLNLGVHSPTLGPPLKSESRNVT